MRIQFKHAIAGVLGVVLAVPMALAAFSPSASSAALIMSESTPGAVYQGRQVALTVPDGWECQIPQMNFLTVLGILNNVQEWTAYSGRVDSVWNDAILPGAPLSAEDENGIAQTLYQLAACANSLDPLRVMPLLSEDLIATLVAKVAYAGGFSGDFSTALESLPLVASDTFEQGGMAVPDVVESWYDEQTTKRVWAIVEVPIDSTNYDGELPQFLVTFVYDKYYWVIDSIWVVKS